MIDPRLERLAKLLVHYCLELKEGQLVSMSASTLATPLISEVYREILQAGARPLLNLTFPGANYLYYKHASDEVLSGFHPHELKTVEEVDALLSVSCNGNSRELSNVDHSRVALYRKARQPLRDVWDQKEAQGKFKWVVVGFPVDSMAQDAGMSLKEYEDFVFEACGCHLSDPVAFWKEQSEKMKAAHKMLEGSKKLRIQGPKTDLTLNVEGRKWVICDGRLNMPDGEIFTSPVEDSAEGEIFFDIPTTYSGVEAGGIHLKLKAGRIVSATAERGESFVLQMLDMDKGSRFMGEVAFGVNRFIQKPSRNILFDEKIGGTMHLAVGASYPEAGGKNKSGLHWDMVKEMKNGGTVEVDGKRVYENGEFRI
ncbi:aminopeptidase [Bdellovibrionota bacterium FG-2]